jgi:hypothetical protein
MIFKNKLFNISIYLTIFLLSCVTLCSIFVKTPAILKLNQLFIFISVILIVIIFACLFYFLNKSDTTINKTTFFLLLIVLTVLPRLIWVIFVGTVPASDFGHMHDFGVNASKGIFTEYPSFYTFFPFKFGYGFILGAIYKIFGVSVLAVKLFNVLLSVCLAWILYWIGKMVYGERAGRITSVLFSLWPAQIMYCSVEASEHVFIVFFILGLGLFIKYHKGIMNVHTYFWLFMTGLILSVSQIVRPIATILFPVFILYLFLFFKTNYELKKSFFHKIKIILLISTGFVIGMAAINFPLQKLTGVQVWRSSSSVNLLEGTNYKSSGMFNVEDFSILDEYKYDYDKIKEEAGRRAIERIKSNPVQFLKLTYTKFGIQWADENYGYYWSTYKVEKNKITNAIISEPKAFAAIAQFYYIIILISAIIGCLFIRKKCKYETIMFILIIGGIFVAYTFFEVQPRYHFPAVPLFMLIAGYGIDRLGIKVKEIENKV